MSKLVNLTPHDLNVIATDGTSHVIPKNPDGKIARVNELRDNVNGVQGEQGQEFSLQVVSYNQVTGLPAPEDGTVYIVSQMVVAGLIANGCQRSDVVFPGILKRNESGAIVGCVGFSCM